MSSIQPQPYLPSGSFMTPILISLIGTASSSLFLMLYHLILIRYCKRRRQRERQAADGSNIDGFHSTMPNGQLILGVDEKVLQTIPIFSYSSLKGELFRGDQNECVVCLCELQEGEMVRLLPSCSHAFHLPCIDKWFMERSNCPVCRSPIIEPNTSIMLPSDSGRGEEERVSDLAHHQIQVGEGTFNNHVAGDVGDSANSGRVRSSSNARLLRHCVSLILPRELEKEEPEGQVNAGLKRSLSLDQSHITIVIQRENMK